MSKYIIELDYDLQRVVGVGVKQGTVWVKDYDVDDLEELCADYINEHYGQLQDVAYRRGFENGKEAINKGCEGCRYSGTPQGDSPCFSCSNYYPNNWQKQDDEIKVGDVVAVYRDSNKYTFVVTKVSDEHVWGIDADGCWNIWDINDVTKTGRHFDIESILEDMRE